MKEDIFDDIIKHKMENLSVKSTSKDSWSLFESKNPNFGKKSINEDIAFDTTIKQKIENLTSSVANLDVWSTFESFNEDSTKKGFKEEESFDNIIKNSLQHISPSYMSSHWHMMKTKLNTIEERKNTIFVAKIMEFAAIFLIIFTYLHWSVWMDNKVIQPEKDDQMQYANTDIPLKEKEDHQLNLILTKNISVSALKINKDRQFSILNINDENISVSSETPSLAIMPENEIVQNPALMIAALQKEEKVLQSNNELVQPEDFSTEINQVPTLDMEALHSEFAISYPMQVSVRKFKPTYTISAFGSTDVNLINTPFDKLYSKASYNKEALNNSFGINLSKRIDRFELETGLGYARRDYQPAIVREAFGQKENYYSEVSLNKISYDIATIPLNFKYHFISQANWGVYIMAGAALNLVMNADYVIDEVKVEGRPAPGRYTPEVARLEKKPFIDGILAGENIKENYFASIGFGFGIEKKICSHTSIYIQPSYQRQILSADIGIGPNKDKIHTSSLQFGVKTLLN